MKFTKSRVFGAIVLILAALLIFTGVSGRVVDRAGTPLAAAYAQSQEHRQEAERLSAAVAAAQEALDRADKRASDALSEAQDCVTQAANARQAAQDGDYDPETDVGALGQAILDAQQAGEDVTAIYERFGTVANADLIAALDTAKTDAGRAEKANEEALSALQALVEAAQALDETAAFEPLPAEVAHAAVPKLGDRTGLDRLATRADNYVTRGETSVSNAQALREAGQTAIETAQAVLADHPAKAADAALSFIRTRNEDLMAAGAVLLVIGACLTFFPAWLSRKWKVRLFRNGFLFVAVTALLAAALHYASGEMWDLMRQGVFDTLYMTIPSTLLAYLVGLPLGVLLVITSPGHIRENHTLNNAVGTVVNFLRSIPFIILLVMLFDVTRFVMGTAIGTRACIFPLFISAFPYCARIVEGSLAEVDKGVIEAAESMGSTTWQIIRKVLVPEAMPSLINGAALCMTTILAYTAMAGSAGGDGLGKIAITYGLNYHEYDIMYVSSLLLVALVQLIQIGGGILTRAVDHRKK